MNWQRFFINSDVEAITGIYIIFSGIVCTVTDNFKISMQIIRMKNRPVPYQKKLINDKGLNFCVVIYLSFFPRESFVIIFKMFIEMKILLFLEIV